jgi:hypothetical protein
MRNVSDKRCRENQNTHFIFNNFFSENRAVYEIVWKNMVQLDKPQLRCTQLTETIDHMMTIVFGVVTLFSMAEI